VAADIDRQSVSALDPATTIADLLGGERAHVGTVASGPPCPGIADRGGAASPPCQMGRRPSLMHVIR
jgi:hypothetical protein